MTWWSPSDAIALTKALARSFDGTCVVLDEERSMARLVLGGWTVDIARQRRSRIEDDLWRRDYRINAIAVSLQPWGELVDPTGGLSDLQQGMPDRRLGSQPDRRSAAVAAGIAADGGNPSSPSRPDHGTGLSATPQRLPEAAPERILAELQRLIEVRGR